jgi:hypothetical protein
MALGGELMKWSVESRPDLLSLLYRIFRAGNYVRVETFSFRVDRRHTLPLANEDASLLCCRSPPGAERHRASKDASHTPVAAVVDQTYLAMLKPASPAIQRVVSSTARVCGHHLVFVDAFYRSPTLQAFYP